MESTAPRVARFGLFELDLVSRELRKQGLKVKLADQPVQILLLLLERAGEPVTREELRQKLWPADTFVDFDAGVNSAIKKLRDAFGDSAETPRFIETLPRRGYRFIAPIEQPPAHGDEHRTIQAEVPRRRRRWVTGAIAAAIAAAAMVPRVGNPTPPSSPSPQTAAVSPEADDLYQKGLRAQGRVSYQQNLAAVSYFEQAVAKQPDFAMAHARLALAWMQFLFGGPMPPDEVLAKAEKAARTALALDDTLKDAHRVLATVLRTYGDHAGADAEVDRLVKSWPSVESFVAQTESLIHRHRFPEAIAAGEHARQLDSRSVNAHVMLGRAHRAAGDHGRAIAEFQRAAQMEGWSVLFQLGATFVLRQDLKAAIPTFEKAVSNSNTPNPRVLAYLGYAYALDGRTREARQILQQLIASRLKEYVSSFGIALVHDALGDKDAALAALERASREHAVEFNLLDAYPVFKTLSSEPRYLKLTRRRPR